MIGIIDYDAGNIKSVEKALAYIGEETIVSRDPEMLLKADKVILPHMGWNSLHLQNNGRLFQGIPEDTYVYFVHSYYLHAEEPEIVKAVTDYSTTIHASVEKGNVFACQFHPEKSSRYGLKILENFAKLEKEGN